MHGLVNRAIECFLRDTYGDARWASIACAGGVDAGEFETMLEYGDAVTDAVLDAAAASLDKPVDDLLEDLGLYLVSHPDRERLRRLLRFGGVSFEDFLHSLDDLRERGRLAVPDLDLPDLELRDEGEGRFSVTCRARHPGFAPVVTGLLQAMADDYGALIMLERVPDSDSGARIEIRLLDRTHAAGRRFELAGVSVPFRQATT